MLILKMIYGIAYLFIIFFIAFIWLFLAIIKKSEFINKLILISTNQF